MPHTGDKAYEDGIADYLGQDDSEWNFTGVEFGDVDKEDPRVEFHFTTIEEAAEQVDELNELRKDRARLEWLLNHHDIQSMFDGITCEDIDAAMESDKS